MSLYYTKISVINCNLIQQDISFKLDKVPKISDLKI